MVQRMSFCVGLAVCVVVAVAMAKSPAVNVGDVLPHGKMVPALRGRGPEGLAAALAKYDELRRQRTELATTVAKSSGDVSRELARIDEQLKEWQAVIDQVGGQRGCSVSRLYWHTDLAAAQSEAARTGRPILSLRMLGKLTDEFSCANSRFFRTALYSNQNISDYLRDHFVLHWQSVRPVPRVTIDFGDGRKLERTLTGNSAHYVLAADGTPLDVLPGLYSPHRFHQWLERMQTLHAGYAAADATARAKLLGNYHVRMQDSLLQQWGREIQQLGEEKSALVSFRIDNAIDAARQAGDEVPDPDHAPDAKVAAFRAVSKGRIETPVLKFANLGGRWVEQGMDDELWHAIAQLHREDVRLDEASVAVMRNEFPQAAAAARVVITKSIQEDPVLRMARSFENSIALDTVRNEYLLHRRIHEQFAEGDAMTANYDALNEWVYAELFLTPSSDPWLGLAPQDVYTALEGDGRVGAANEFASRAGGL